jgi:hypothetical protein
MYDEYVMYYDENVMYYTKTDNVFINKDVTVYTQCQACIHPELKTYIHIPKPARIHFYARAQPAVMGISVCNSNNCSTVL